MSFWELFIIAVGLSMDAFAVAVCKGLSVQSVRPAHALTVGLYFGGAQALMPLAGWLLGSQFARHVTKLAPWIAFVLLAWIGGNMIRESRAGDKEDEGQPSNGEVRHKELLVLAVATSIDALAVGVTFSMVELSVSIGLAVVLIGCTTFLISLGGVYVGNVFGARYKSRAELVGGAILILIGVKVLLEHLLG